MILYCNIIKYILQVGNIPIVNILGSIDDKIENNGKLCGNIISAMELLFDKEIKNLKYKTSWTENSLIGIANYINGLPMQKFRPQANNYIPVAKIRELGQGCCDSNSEKARANIDNCYIIDNGDIVFSWSGTLMVSIWCGGKAGLNQHLFKVTSESYPNWFIFLWTKKHLQKFQNIALGKAVTMGHIKRSDLEAAIVFTPNNQKLQEMNQIFSAFFDSYVTLNDTTKKLIKLKQLYLKKFFD